MIHVLNQNDDHSERWARPFAIILLIVVAVGVCAGVMWARAKPDQRRAILPDGSTVEFLGTAVGGAQFTTETKWQHVARQYLPAVFVNCLPPVTSGSCSAGANGLTVYLRVSNSATTAAGGWPAWQGYTTEDETGFRYPNDGGYCSFGPNSSNTVYGLSLRAFPRRQKKFLLHLLDAKGLPVATFPVPNPITGPFPEWRPLPLPQSQTNGPVTLTLESLEAASYYFNPRRRLETTDPAWIKADQHYAWMATDATSNEATMLSLREPAWKLHALIYRKHPEDSATNQLTLANLAIPAPGAFIPIDQIAERGGAGIKVWVMSGAGRFGLSNGITRFMLPASQGTSGHSTSSGSSGTVETWGCSDTQLLVEIQNVQGDDDVRFSVRDDTGREIKVEASGYEGRPSGSRLYTPHFTPTDAAKSLTLKIVINRPLAFEFVVNPADVRITKP